MDILKKILEDKRNRKLLIKKFQEEIWNNEDASEILKELAFDLDFYEPNSILRDEDPNYYGDDILEREIKTVLKQIDNVPN